MQSETQANSQQEAAKSAEAGQKPAQCQGTTKAGKPCQGPARRAQDADGVWRCMSHSTSPEAVAMRRANATIGRAKGGRPTKRQSEAKRIQKEMGTNAPPVVVIERTKTTDILTADGWSHAANAAYQIVEARIMSGDLSAIPSAVQLLRAAQSEMQRRDESSGEDARLAKALEAMKG